MNFDSAHHKLNQVEKINEPDLKVTPSYKGVFHRDHIPATIGMIGFIICFSLMSLQIGLNPFLQSRQARVAEVFVGERDTGGFEMILAKKGSFINEDSHAYSEVMAAIEFDSKFLAASEGKIFVYDGNGWRKLEGVPELFSITAMEVLDNKLFFGGKKTEDSKVEIYNYSQGSFNKLPDIAEAVNLTVLKKFNNQLFAATNRGDATSSKTAEIYRFDGTNWQKVSSSQPGQIMAGEYDGIWKISAMEEFNNKLFVATNEKDKAQVYSYDGVTWQRISDAEPGKIMYRVGSYRAKPYDGIDGITDFSVMNNQLYVATKSLNYDEKIAVYAYDGSKWSKVSDGEMEDNGKSGAGFTAMKTLKDKIYVAKWVGGKSAAEIFSYDGTNWEKITAEPGCLLADCNMKIVEFDRFSIFKDKLMIIKGIPMNLEIFSYNPDYVCVPDCDGKQCGDDGCGGQCGQGCSSSNLFKNSCVENTCCEFVCGDKCCTYEEFYRYDNEEVYYPDWGFQIILKGPNKIKENESSTYRIEVSKPNDVDWIRIQYYKANSPNDLSQSSSGITGQLAGICMKNPDPNYGNVAQLYDWGCELNLSGFEKGGYYLWLEASRQYNENTEVRYEDFPTCAGDPMCAWNYQKTKDEVTRHDCSQTYPGVTQEQCDEIYYNDDWFCGYFGTGHNGSKDCGKYDYMWLEVGESENNEEIIEIFVPSPAPQESETKCLQTGGNWVQFPDSCVDKCGTEDMVCAQVITFGCDCGAGCWDGSQCVAQNECQLIIDDASKCDAQKSGNLWCVWTDNGCQRPQDVSCEDITYNRTCDGYNKPGCTWTTSAGFGNYCVVGSSSTPTPTPTLTPTPTATPDLSRYDLNSDGSIDNQDNILFIRNYYTGQFESKTLDFNNDGKVNLTDYSLLKANIN